MYKIEYKDNTQKILKKFIESYKNTFLERFSNTWIYDEDIIKKNYINKSISFYQKIIDSIEKNLGREKIYWYSPITNRKASIVISVFNYRLRVFYIQTKSKKLREIYNIEFNS